MASKALADLVMLAHWLECLQRSSMLLFAQVLDERVLVNVQVALHSHSFAHALARMQR
jgi:hypothetical protein